MSGAPLITEWRNVDVIHACRCAKHSSVHIENEAAFLLELMKHKGWTLEQLVADTLMSQKGYKWLTFVCGNDSVALSGVRKMRKTRRLIASELIKQARYGK
jgi:hypothetical protein|tara:strand:- start:1787 stop:2089 length:303 start_codon:yes stop_codon:yes gene_type:complete